MATLFSLPNTTIFILLVLSCFLSVKAQVNHLNQSCYGGNYDILNASDFPTNRDKALGQLTLLASSSYFNTNTNTNTTGLSLSKVYALFQCRYDVTPSVCLECVMNAAKEVKLWCFLNVEAVIFYDECTLHYANHSIFAIQEDLPALSVYSVRNVSDNDVNDDQFGAVLRATISGLISDVVSGFLTSSRYFATTKTNYKSDTISALAQCNADITGSDCRGCLQNAFGNFSVNYTDVGIGKVYTPSCLLTYKLSSFDDGTPHSPPFNFPLSSGDVSASPTIGFSRSGSNAAGSSLYVLIMASILIVISSLILLSV